MRYRNIACVTVSGSVFWEGCEIIGKPPVVVLAKKIDFTFFTTNIESALVVKKVKEL